MKINFEFDTSKDNEEYEYNIFIQSQEMYYVLNELKDFFRSKIKYSTEYNKEQFELLENIYNDFYNLINENKINLDL